MTKQDFDEITSQYKLMDLLAENSTNQVKKLLKTFSCEISNDLQDFLHNKAITFERNLRSRTYLYANNENKSIVAYFTLAINYLETDKFKSEIIQILSGYASYTDKTNAIPCYLIRQLAIRDEYRKQGIGNFLLTDALKIADNAQTSFGGRFVLIDSVNNDKVINFYEQNSFIAIENDKSLKSIKMIKPYFECSESQI